MRQTYSNTFPDLAVCVQPQALPSTPRKRASINASCPSAWVNRRESSHNLFIAKYRTVIMCQFSFIRGKKPFSSVLLLMCLKILNIPSKALQMATKVDRNATVTSFCACGQKRMKTLFPSPETSISTISRSRPRHLQLVECLLHTFPSEMPPHYRILAKVK